MQSSTTKRPTVGASPLLVTAFFGLTGVFAALPASAQVNMCTGTASEPASACYRYLCNGMDSSGNIDGDGCGTCNDAAPTKWGQPTIAVRYDATVVPAGITTTQWTNVFTAVLNGWTNVAGSNLTLQNAGTAQYRRFGYDYNNEANGANSQNEVFWITSLSEFQQKVPMTSVNGVLGVTLASYPYCDREIIDADIVMNGVASAGFNWAANDAACNQGYCSNAQSTLLHEMGHFLGVGHPCTGDSPGYYCSSWTVMGASAGYYEPETPQLADVAVLQKLYPGQAGQIGSGCTGTTGCTAPYSCSQIGDVSYCTENCTTTADCDSGFECDVDGTGKCVFAGTLLPGVGDACLPPDFACEPGAVCVGSDTGGTCYEECTTANPQCGANETCIPFDGQPQFGFCIGSAGPGDFCDNASVVCAQGVCIENTCRNACDPVNGAGCLGGEHCVYFGERTCTPGQATGAAHVTCPNITCPANGYCPDYTFCYPGGNALEGASCDGQNFLSCAPGNLCLSTGTAAECFHRCDQSFDCSNASDQCITIPDNNNNVADPISYCFSTAGDGDEGCDLRRGNYDCPNGEGCVDDDDNDDFGECEEGAMGEVGTGGFCESPSECNGGLCVNGVCTRPCDYDCPGGYECAEDEIPGGLCRPLSCADDESICDEDWNCVYSPAERNVCAREPKPMCTCVAGGDADAGDPMKALALLGIMGVLFRRRRS